MTFSERAKEEILLKKFDNTCCRIAALTAFIRGAGTIITEGSFVGFEIVTENKFTRDVFAIYIKDLYGEKVSYREEQSGKKTKYIIKCLSQKSLEILTNLGIIEVSGKELLVNFGIDKYLVENKCCKRAFIIGSFIGGGSVTIPSLDSESKTNYHLEFVFSTYQTASDFVNLLTDFDFLPKLIFRKNDVVVYIKNGEEIASLLGFMGAVKSCLELEELIIKKSIKNETNRKINCEMGNLSKQVEASIKQIENIQVIDEILGLDSLPSTLRDVANERINNPDSTLEEIAKNLNLTKSCVNHRFRRINEIAEELKND